MIIEQSQVGNNVVLHLAGRMDVDGAREFERQCQVCIAEGKTKLVADLSRLAYVNSLGLRSFISVREMLGETGGELQICGLTGLVRQVFEITKLNCVFPLHDSVESALAKD